MTTGNVNFNSPPYSLYSPSTLEEEQLLTSAVREMTARLRSIPQWPSPAFNSFLQTWGIMYSKIGASDTATREHIMELAESQHIIDSILL